MQDFKSYTGKHDIFYFGTLDHKSGEINGKWGFRPGSGDGGFRMKKVWLAYSFIYLKKSMVIGSE